jgi:hypothetical protein
MPDNIAAINRELDEEIDLLESGAKKLREESEAAIAARQRSVRGSMHSRARSVWSSSVPLVRHEKTKPKLFEEIITRSLDARTTARSIDDFILDVRKEVAADGGVPVEVEFSPSNQRRLQEAIRDIVNLREEIESLTLDSEFEAGLITVEEFYKRREELAIAQLDREIELVKERIALEEELIDAELERRILDAGDDSADTIANALQDLTKNFETLAAAEKELVELALQRRLLLIKADKDRLKAIKEAEKAEREALEAQVDSITNLRSELLKLQGQDLPAALAAAEQQFVEAQREAGERLSEALEAAEKTGASIVEYTGIILRHMEEIRLINLIRQQEEVNALLDEARERLEDVSDAEERFNDLVKVTDAQVRTGVLTQAEARLRQRQALESVIQETIAARDAALKFAEDNGIQDKILPDLAEIDIRLIELQARAAELGITFQEGVTAGLRAVKAEADDVFAFARELVVDLADSLSSGLADALVDVIQGAKTAEEAFRDFAKQVLTDVARMIIRFATLRLIAGAFGGGGFNAGGIIPGFAMGGQIPGRGPNADRRLIAATPGEFVIQRPAVDYYGSGLFAMLNRMRLPASLGARYPGAGSSAGLRFNEGGIVGGSDNGPGVSVAIVPPTETTMERLLNGGRNAMLAFMDENSTEINNALGANG